MASTNIISNIELVSFILGLFMLANNSSQNVIVFSWRNPNQLFCFRCKLLVLNTLITREVVHLFLLSVTLFSKSSYSPVTHVFPRIHWRLQQQKLLHAVDLWALFRPFLLGRGHVVQTTHWPWSSWSPPKENNNNCGMRNEHLSYRYVPIHFLISKAPLLKMTHG